MDVPRIQPSDFFTAPPRLWSRAEVIGKPCPVPNAPGVYGWYFRHLPDSVPLAGCTTVDDSVLAYVGISPKAPPGNGKPPSRQALRTRIRYHYTGNAEGSTLRLTLGCLLSETLGIELRRVGSGSRFTFGPGEQVLSQWMQNNARVCWLVTAEPWAVEATLIEELVLPLNLDQNAAHPFAATLSALRKQCRARAKTLPVMSDW